MRKWTGNCVLTLSVLAFCGATAWAEDLVSVEKKIVKQWQKHKSLKANVTRTEGTEAKGRTATSKGEGTYEFMRRGDEVLFRKEMRTIWEVDAGPRKTKLEMNTLKVCDGKYEYELSERMGWKTAVKTKPDPASGANLKTFLENLRAKNDLKLLEEEAVEGQDAYVIEATPKNLRPGNPHKTLVYYFSKDHGVLLKEERRDKDGKAVLKIAYTDLEFDVKIDPKRFEFKAPEGVIVQDLTGE
ncbi:MAG: outer membrane lipoprotein carrier protein LolA [Phycisphaerae bacterium]